MTYQVLLRRNATGEERLVTESESWDDSWLYFWTDGNFGCDCNRHLAFERAGGREPESIFEQPCGDDAYTAVKAILPDGSEIQIDQPYLDVEPPQ